MKLTRENRRTRAKTCPSATLPTTNPTWTDPGSNPGLRGGRPAANRLSHGTADFRPYLIQVNLPVHLLVIMLHPNNIVYMYADKNQLHVMITLQFSIPMAARS
jgi:hypothetical protein